MKSFRKYLKEDVDLIEKFDVTSPIGIGIDANLDAQTYNHGLVEFGVILGAWSSGSKKTFEKLTDLSDKEAASILKRDAATLKDIITRELKRFEDNVTRELAKLGYK